MQGHAQSCVGANVNILSLYGDAIPYNICRNVEWQVCAAKGALPGQGGKPTIRFAYRPGALDAVKSEHPLGSCTGYHPKGCYENGYASSDIFYMESCVYSLMCKNRDALWHVEQGQDWQCDMDWGGYQKLRDALLHRGWAAPKGAKGAPK